MQTSSIDADASANGPRIGLVVSQLLALQVIRRALAPDGAEGPGWRDVGVVLRRAHAQMVRQQQVGLVVADEGAVLLTRHEKRLLRATAAAQLPDAALVDNLIFTLAPGRALRPFLAAAVERLAAGLRHHGHALPLTPLPSRSTLTSMRPAGSC